MATALSCPLPPTPPTHFTGADVREQSACPGLQNGWPSPFIQRKISLFRRIPGAKFCYHHHIHRALSHPFLEKGQPNTPLLFLKWNRPSYGYWPVTTTNARQRLCDRLRSKAFAKAAIFEQKFLFIFLTCIILPFVCIFSPLFPSFFSEQGKKNYKILIPEKIMRHKNAKFKSFLWKSEKRIAQEDEKRVSFILLSLFLRGQAADSGVLPFVRMCVKYLSSHSFMNKKNKRKSKKKVMWRINLREMPRNVFARWERKKNIPNTTVVY